MSPPDLPLLPEDPPDLPLLPVLLVQISVTGGGHQSSLDVVDDLVDDLVEDLVEELVDDFVEDLVDDLVDDLEDVLDSALVSPPELPPQSIPSTSKPVDTTKRRVYTEKRVGSNSKDFQLVLSKVATVLTSATL